MVVSTVELVVVPASPVRIGFDDSSDRTNANGSRPGIGGTSGSPELVPGGNPAGT